MSCLKFAAFRSDYEKYTNFDIILCRLKRLKVSCLECLSYLVISYLNTKLMS